MMRCNRSFFWSFGQDYFGLLGVRLGTWIPIWPKGAADTKYFFLWCFIVYYGEHTAVLHYYYAGPLLNSPKIPPYTGENIRENPLERTRCWFIRTLLQGSVDHQPRQGDRSERYPTGWGPFLPLIPHYQNTSALAQNIRNVVSKGKKQARQQTQFCLFFTKSRTSHLPHIKPASTPRSPQFGPDWSSTDLFVRIDTIYLGVLVKLLAQTWATLAHGLAHQFNNIALLHLRF